MKRWCGTRSAPAYDTHAWELYVGVARPPPQLLSSGVGEVVVSYAFSFREMPQYATASCPPALGYGFVWQAVLFARACRPHVTHARARCEQQYRWSGRGTRAFLSICSRIARFVSGPVGAGEGMEFVCDESVGAPFSPRRFSAPGPAADPGRRPRGIPAWPTLGADS